MAEDKKIVVFGDGTKDTNLESAGSCANCSTYNGASSPFVFTPINLTYKIKAKYIYAKDGSEDTLALTPNGDTYVEYNLMSIESIDKGAEGKNAAEELKNYYNDELDQGGGEEEMTIGFAEKVIAEFHTELSKSKWKTFFEKVIKNSIKTENLLKSTFQDYINHDFITDHNRKAISYSGWSGNSVEKTYSVKVNVGVKPKFLKSCTLEDDKSRLTLTKPEKKFCKAFLAVIGEEKELSDDNFLFEVTDQYSEPTPRGFFATTALGKIEDLDTNEKLITPATMLQTTRDYEKLVKDGAFAGFQGAASNGGGPFKFNSEEKAWSIGAQFGSTRVEVEADMSGGQAKQDIYVRYKMAIGPDGKIGQTTVTIGGRKASLGYALQQIAKNMQGWLHQVWMSWHKPNDSSSLAAVELAEDNADKVKDKTEKLKDDAEVAADKIADAAGAVAGATPETAAAVAQQLASVKAAAEQANTAAIAAQTEQTILSTGSGSNPVTSNTNEGNINKAVTQIGQTIQHLDTVIENLGTVPANLPAAQSSMTAAVNKSAEASNTATEADTKATEVKTDATGLVNVVKNLTEIAGSGRDVDPDTRNMLNTFGAKVEEAKNVVKDIVADNNTTVPPDLIDKIGEVITPVPEGNIPKTSTPKSDLQADTRIDSGDTTKGNTSFIFKGSATETPNPISTIGANEGEGFKSDNNEGWQNPESVGFLQFKITPANEDNEPQNGKFSQ